MLPKPYYENDLGVLYNADCLTILPHLEPVDLVMKSGLTNNTEYETINHEEKQARTIQDGRGAGFVGATQRGNQVALPRTAMVDGTNSKIFQHIPNGDGEGFAEVENQFAGSRKEWGGERTIQEWETESSLSPNDREGQMLKLREDNGPCGSPQERGPFRQPFGEPSDTLRELPFKLPQKDVVGKTGNQAVVSITDPPYGIKMDKGFEGFEGFGGFGVPIARKQYIDSWDSERPSKEHFDAILKISDKSMIFGGNYFADILPISTHWIVWDKKNTMPTFGDAELIWTNIKRKSVKIFVCEYNGLLGKEGTRVHPTQKPIKLIVDLISKYSNDTDLILDPFLGSGTTAVACERLKRKWIGIEIEEKYCSIAVKRIEAERKQLKLF